MTGLSPAAFRRSLIRRIRSAAHIAAPVDGRPRARFLVMNYRYALRQMEQRSRGPASQAGLVGASGDDLTVPAARSAAGCRRDRHHDCRHCCYSMAMSVETSGRCWAGCEAPVVAGCNRGEVLAEVGCSRDEVRCEVGSTDEARCARLSRETDRWAGDRSRCCLAGRCCWAAVACDRCDGVRRVKILPHA